MLFQGIKAQDTLRITLPEALDIALSESPTIKIADKEIERVDYSKKSAWYGLIPNFEGSGQYAKYVSPATMSLAGMTIELPTDFNANASLSASLPLFAPALWESIRMTKVDMQLAVEKARASKITLRNDVLKAYYSVMLAQDSYQALLSSHSLSEEVYKQAKKRFELGLAAEYDVISAEVQMKNLEPNILEVENGIEQAKQFLKILMGVDVAQPIKIVGSLSDFENEIVAINNSKNFSINENTDIKQINIQQQQLQSALRLQRTQRMPMLAAFGQYGYAGTGNNAGNNPFTGMPMPADESWFSQGMLVGLQLNIPLTGIFTNIAKEKQTKIQIEQLGIQRDYLQNSINVQMLTAQNNMEKAAKQADSAKSNEAMAQKGYDISLKRYENGMGTIIELQNASLALTQAKLAYNQALSSFLTAKADLEKIMGREVI